MRDQWYGDNRDLVKWGVLLELARRFGLRHVLQVLYYRPSTYGRLEIDGQECDLPRAVVHHFRRATAVSALEGTAKVDVIEEPFDNRDQYLALLLNRIDSRAIRPGIVFLDPDTGLEPRVPGLEHVREDELRAIWGRLRAEDMLVIYQHQTNRKGLPWVDAKKSQCERALGVRPGTVKLAQAPAIAKDVAFFYVTKGG